jgi:hypothetical protein
MRTGMRQLPKAMPLFFGSVERSAIQIPLPSRLPHAASASPAAKRRSYHCCHLR